MIDSRLDKERYKTLQEYYKMRVRCKQRMKDDEVLKNYFLAHWRSDTMILNKDLESLDKKIEKLEQLLNK